MRKFLLMVTALGLLASACSSDTPTAQGPGGTSPSAATPLVIHLGDQEIILTSALSGFDSCDALLDHLRTTGAEHVGPYGFNSNGWYGGPIAFAEGDSVAVTRSPDVAVDDTSGGAADFATNESAAAPRVAQGGADGSLVEGVDFSGTNVQETGVDEADIIKTDGERIYVVSSGQLVVVDVASREVLGTVDVNTGWTSELFVSGNEVIYITSGWNEGPHPLDDIAVGAPAIGITEDELSILPYYNSSSTTITRISISAGGAPSIIESLVVAGDYVSSRAVNGTARIVLRSNPQDQFPFVYPAGPAGEDRATESNKQALLDSQLTDWLPSYVSLDASGQETSSGLLSDCARTQAPTEFAGFGVVSVHTVAIDGTIDPSNTAAVLAPGETVYASTDSLYVTTTRWLDNTEVDDETAWQQIWDARQTSIHRFDIRSDTNATYVASGSVPGDIHDQFALSEHEGHLRVVATTGQPWDDTSESMLHVLQLSPDGLAEVGSVGDMGNGETVQSVRFDGDTGYVVTFRQIDPFYTLDISDPTNPIVAGELKIPGFSSYLHPIGDGMVIGVGSDGDNDGRITGAKVSLFDASDIANPIEVAVWSAPDSWNGIGWDHRSFLWWGAENTAVVPVSIGGDNWSGAVVLEVLDGSITELGRIDHLEDGVVPGQTDCAELGIDDVPGADQGDFETELAYMVVEGYAKVLRCESNDQGGASGFDCSPEPWLLEEAANIGISVEDGQRIEICWPVGNDVQQIVRTMMLPGGELWSMSVIYGDLSGQAEARLQVNDLSSLTRLAALEL